MRESLGIYLRIRALLSSDPAAFSFGIAGLPDNRICGGAKRKD
jgi:hypothetical protein